MILSAKEKSEGLKREMVGTELIKSTMEIDVTAYKMVKKASKVNRV